MNKRGVAEIQGEGMAEWRSERVYDERTVKQVE